MSGLQVSNANQWLIIGRRKVGIQLRQTVHQVGHHHSAICTIVRKYQLSNDVKYRSRSEGPRKTSVQKDNAPRRMIRRKYFTHSSVLKRKCLPNILLSTRIVRNRLKSFGYHARKPIKWHVLTSKQKAIRIQWCQVMLEPSLSMKCSSIGRQSLFAKYHMYRWMNTCVTATT